MNVKMGSFDRRSLFMLAAGLLTVVILRFIFSGHAPTQEVAASDSVPMAEKRLGVATAPAVDESGTGGDISDIAVRCECGVARRLSDAAGSEDIRPVREGRR